MTESFKGTLWLTSPEYQQQNLLAATTDLERLKTTFISFHESDMTDSGWVRVGTAEVIPIFSSREVLTANAVQAVEAQIKAVEAEYLTKLNQLREYRSTLLCLEAPK